MTAATPAHTQASAGARLLVGLDMPMPMQDVITLQSPARRCFGLFDGPKQPESTAIFGQLRSRPTSMMGRRLNAGAHLAATCLGAVLIAV